MRFRQIHLDFHTSEKIDGIGSCFNKKQFQEALKTGHVDSITVFSKCHHGWSYHPTKVNEIHPGLKFDLLGEQLKACAEIGVRAPVYISAGLDEKEAVRHPEWQARNKDDGIQGWVPSFYVPGYHRLCFNTSYLDLLLAQIREVMENYHPCEIFLDICTPTPCYCAACRAGMKAEGLDPTKVEDAQKYADEVYLRYTKAVRDTIDEYDKNCAVFHNFGHLHCGRRDFADVQSHFELESLPTGGWGYDNFPFSASYASTLGKDYLGMTGKFHKSWGEFGGFKHPNALRYEVALSAALGAGSSVGDQLHPCGEMDMTTYKLIGAAYAELEEKEPWSKDTVTVADIGLLSSEAVGCFCGKYDPSRTPDIGANRILLEGKYLYTVIDAECDFSAFKLLVLPDTARVNEKLAEKLRAYVKNGGKLLLSGESGLYTDHDEFCVDAGITYNGVNEFSPTYLQTKELLDTNNGVLLMYGRNHCITPGSASVLAYRQNPYFNRTWEHFCSHLHAPNDRKEGAAGLTLSKAGNVAYIGWDVFTDYATMGSLQCKEIVRAAITELLGDADTITTTLCDRGVITLREQPENDRLICHLLFAHTTVRGKDTEVIEDLIPLCDTTVTVKLDKAPKRVYLAPQMEDVSYDYSEGVLSFVVDEFTCHQMVVIDR